MKPMIHALTAAVSMALAAGIFTAGCAADETVADVGERSVNDTDEPTPHQHANDPASRAAAMQKQYGLTAAQTAQVETAMREHAELPDRIGAIREILDPQQRTAFDEKLIEHHEALLARMKQRDPSAHAAALQERLGLTDAQRSKLEAVFRDEPTDEELAKAFSTILTPDQRAELHRLELHLHGPAAQR